MYGSVLRRDRDAGGGGGGDEEVEEVRVAPFGSFATQEVCIFSSDVDMCIWGAVARGGTGPMITAGVAGNGKRQGPRDAVEFVGDDDDDEEQEEEMSTAAEIRTRAR